MAPFGYLKSRHEPTRQKDIRTLVFVHGMGATRATFFPMQGYLKLAGFPRQYAYTYKTRGTVEAMALRLKRELESNIKGGHIDLIAHSLGGLVSRFYVQKLGGARRVDRLITIGTPHEGTEAHVYLPTQVVQQMDPRGPFMTDLNQLPPPDGVSVTSIGGGADILVIPHANALCHFGEQRFFPELGHNALLLSPQVMSEVRGALNRQRGGPGSYSKE
jgi:pimeloyl-ACP methyl ester carboxylesterase